MTDLAEALDDPELSGRFGRRLLAVRMHGLGISHAMIAAALRVSDDTVTNYIKLYRDEGLSGLVENRYHRPASSVEPFLEVIKASLAETPVASAAEGAARIAELTSIKLSDSQASRIIRRLGMKYRKSAAFPGGGDPQMQLELK